MIESKSRVAIYCRLSEEDRNKQSETDDSNSIQNQKSMLLQYSLEHGWEVYNIYSDDDYTGSDGRRPEFNRLLEDAKNRKFDIVLCKTQSRFTRELELVEKYIHGLFPIWGIRFISIVDNADTDVAGNKKSRQIIRQAKSHNENSIVVATGCYAEVSKAELEKVEELDIIVRKCR